MNYIELYEIGHTYRSDLGRRTDALTKVSFTIRKGEFVSIVGPSGSGKSTILNLIAGLIKPTTGEVFVDGSPAHSEELGRAMGFVFQDPALLPWRDTAENIALPLELNDGREDAFVRVQTLINIVGLQGFEHAYPSELSGGMRSRVSLARALAIQPNVLLMDEPFGSLDELTAQSIGLQLLDILASRITTVILVTHNISQAVLMSDRIIVLSERPGHVVSDATVSLSRPRTWDTLSSTDFSKALSRVRAVLLGHSHMKGKNG